MTRSRKGIGIGSPEDWQLCLKAYGLDDKQAMEYKLNPIDNLNILAKADIPLLHICGDIDEIVPMKENTLVLEKIYRQLGGDIKVITKKNCGHHPHSLEDPKPIVDFIIKHVRI